MRIFLFRGKKWGQPTGGTAEDSLSLFFGPGRSVLGGRGGA